MNPLKCNSKLRLCIEHFFENVTKWKTKQTRKDSNKDKNVDSVSKPKTNLQRLN